MKKFIYSSLILLLFLGIGTTSSFASVHWGITDLEKFLSCYGYNFNFENATYQAEGNSSYGASYEKLVNYLSLTDSPLIILDCKNADFYSNGNTWEYSSDIDFIIYNAYTSNPKGRKLILTNDSQRGYYYRFGYSSYSYAVDIDNNIVYYLPSYPYVNSHWYENLSGVSHEEFISNEYQEYLLREYGLLYSDTIIYSNQENVIFQNKGIRILQSSFGDKTYKGEVKFLPSLKKVSLTTTQGFEVGQEYDLFLERYQLHKTTDYGISDYPLETIQIGKVNTNTTTVDVSNVKFSTGSMNVYRFCVGQNNFNSIGRNDAYLSTWWYIVNDNTIRFYPNFSQSHYYKFDTLIGYNPDYVGRYW